MRKFDLGRRLLIAGGSVLFLCVLVSNLQAGGSGLNTLVVVNQSSTNSLELGNYFCERRQVPPENVLRISWAGDNIAWGSGDFQTNLLNPLLAALAARQLTNQIDYVVLSMDIPYRTTNATTFNSTTAALFYGVQGGGSDWKNVTNSYAGSEAIFDLAKPTSAPGYSFLTTMLTDDTLANAKRMIDQGVTSDGSFPQQPVVLAKTSDALRSARWPLFDNAVFNTRLAGNYNMYRTNSDSPDGQTNLLGYETGLWLFTVATNAFVPGAIADSMTSFGGIIFGPNGQTTLLSFINAGASGSYGTVVEPTADPEKFPNPQVYFYQARGFSLAECYYQSLNAPYEGLLVGEPLAAPFARTGSGAWLGVSSNAVLQGAAALSVQFIAYDRSHPLSQVDLFIDGKFAQTLTNVPPLPGNQITVACNGGPFSYTVPANASPGSIASGLASLLNANSNTARLAAIPYGDRIELHSLASHRPPPPANFRLSGNPGQSSTAPLPLADNSAGTAPALTTFLAASRESFLSSVAYGYKSCSINGIVDPGTWLQLSVTKTNGTRVSLAVTNQIAGATLADLATPLVSLINSNASLQAPDGVIAEDLGAGAFGAEVFTLRARRPGYSAAALAVTLNGYSSLVLAPAAATPLNDNLGDLQPRNHLYIRAGVTNLALNLTLLTTALADGYHEMTAIAYEGTHVRTQTRATVQVVVSNTPLNATLTLLDLTDHAPVQGSYHVQVSANTNNATAIRLYSTGGLLATATNQNSSTFTIDGSSLGAGLHPIFALVETATGSRYRTQPVWVRLGP